MKALLRSEALAYGNPYPLIHSGLEGTALSSLSTVSLASHAWAYRSIWCPTRWDIACNLSPHQWAASCQQQQPQRHSHSGGEAAQPEECWLGITARSLFL